jgi:hypothetical protein
MLLSRRAYRAAVIAACCAIVLLVIWYMARNLVNVPYNDDWSAGSAVAIHAVDGTLTLEMLLAPWNEHRIFFAKIITALTTLLTNWDTRFEAWFNLIFASGYFVLLLALQRRANSDLLIWTAIPLALLVFSFKQYNNWLIGLQVVFWQVLFFTCLALWLIASRPISWRVVLLSALCAFAATFSLGNGMLLWLVLLPAFWLRGYRRWWHYALWIALGALAVGLYLHQNAILDVEHAGVLIEAPTIVDYGAFFLAYLGSPFVISWELFVKTAQALAIVGLLSAAFCAAYLWYKNDRAALIAPITLVLLSSISGAMLALGRTKLGGELYPLYNPRYVTIASVFWIGLLMLGAATLWHVVKSQYKMAAVALSSLLLGCYGALLLQANLDILLRNIRMSITEEVRACVLNYVTAIKNDQECLRSSAPSPEFFYPMMQELAKRRLTVFGDWQNDFPPAPQPALAHVQPILGGDYVPEWINEPPEGVALFQHPPSTAEQHLQLPNAPQVFFDAEIYVDLRNIREHPDVPQTGADFRLSVREGRRIQTLYEGSFDVNVERAPIPIRVDLSAWRGRAVVLVYETLVRQENASYAWAMWRNPRLVTQ